MKKTTIILLLSLIGYGAVAQTQYWPKYGIMGYGYVDGSSTHSFYGNVNLKTNLVIGPDTASLSRSLVKTFKNWTNMGNQSYYGFNTAATFSKTSSAFTGYGIGNVVHAAIGAANTQNWTGDGAHVPFVGVWSQIDAETGSTGTISKATAFNAVIDLNGANFTFLSGYNANRFNKLTGTVDTLVGYYSDDVNIGIVNYDFWGRSALSRFDKGVQIDGALSRIRSGYALRFNNVANDASFGIFNSGASGANEAKIDANFVPDNTLTRDLGSTTRYWRHVYADTVGANKILTSTNGMIKGDGSKLTGAVDGTDYLSPTTGVKTLTGTANQVTVSSSTGNVTISLPSVVGIDGTSGQLSLNSSNAGKSYFTLKSGGTAYGYFAQEGALLGTSSTIPVLYSTGAFRFYASGALAGEFNSSGKFVLTNTPTTSAGSFKYLTRNISTGEVEETTSLPGTTGTPTISVNANAGTGASASIAGNNINGVVTINFTGVSAANGIMATVTMGGGFSYSTKCTPVLTLESSSTGVAAGTGNLITTNGTTTTWDIVIAPSNLTTSGTFKFNYHNGGY